MRAFWWYSSLCEHVNLAFVPYQFPCHPRQMTSQLRRTFSWTETRTSSHRGKTSRSLWDPHHPVLHPLQSLPNNTNLFSQNLIPINQLLSWIRTGRRGFLIPEGSSDTFFVCLSCLVRCGPSEFNYFKKNGTLASTFWNFACVQKVLFVSVQFSFEIIADYWWIITGTRRERLIKWPWTNV